MLVRIEIVTDRHPNALVVPKRALRWEGERSYLLAVDASGTLRRVDVRDGSYEVTYFVDVQGPQVLSALVDELQSAFPGVGVSFVDQNQLPSV